jgi:hypothetical protein
MSGKLLGDLGVYASHGQVAYEHVPESVEIEHPPRGVAVS